MRFKLFEEYNDYGWEKPSPNKYKKGDYVFVNLSFSKEFYEIDKVERMKLYIDSEYNDNPYIVPAKITHLVRFVTDFPYLVELMDRELSASIGDSNIKRKMTEDEIEDFLTKKEARKYNL